MEMKHISPLAVAVAPYPPQPHNLGENKKRCVWIFVEGSFGSTPRITVCKGTGSLGVSPAPELCPGSGEFLDTWPVPPGPSIMSSFLESIILIVPILRIKDLSLRDVTCLQS